MQYKTTFQDFADQLGIPFVETSAKMSTNVEQLFSIITNEMKARVDSSPKLENKPVIRLREGTEINNQKFTCPCTIL